MRTCSYPGCTEPCNWSRCRAHTALFTAALQDCISMEEHDRLARLPTQQMLAALPGLLTDGQGTRDVVLSLINDARKHGPS
jgi:hypothetical protein